MSRKNALIAAIAAATLSVDNLAAKLETAKAKVATLTGQLAAFDALESLDVGSVVIVSVGRGDTRVETTGTIRAVKPAELIPAKEEGGEPTLGERQFKVEVTRTGDAFDSEFVIVRESQVGIPQVEASEEAAE